MRSLDDFCGVCFVPDALKEARISRNGVLVFDDGIPVKRDFILLHNIFASSQNHLIRSPASRERPFFRGTDESGKS